MREECMCREGRWQRTGKQGRGKNVEDEGRENGGGEWKGKKRKLEERNQVLVAIGKRRQGGRKGRRNVRIKKRKGELEKGKKVRGGRTRDRQKKAGVRRKGKGGRKEETQGRRKKGGNRENVGILGKRLEDDEEKKVREEGGHMRREKGR